MWHLTCFNAAAMYRQIEKPDKSKIKNALRLWLLNQLQIKFNCPRFFLFLWITMTYFKWLILQAQISIPTEDCWIDQTHLIMREIYRIDIINSLRNIEQRGSNFIVLRERSSFKDIVSFWMSNWVGNNLLESPLSQTTMVTSRWLVVTDKPKKVSSKRNFW